MKILSISNNGDQLGICWKLLQEGHDVSTFIRSTGSTVVGQGLYKRGTSWRPLLKKMDMVICDSPGFGAYEDVFRDKGKPVFGTSQVIDDINMGQQETFLERCDISLCSNLEHKATIHGFYNGRRRLTPSFLSFTENRLFGGRLGPLVDCMGCTVLPIHKPTSLLLSFLEQVGNGLNALGGRGLISLSIGWDREGGAWKVEDIHCGFIHDVMEAILEGLREPLIDLLFGVSMGIKDTIEVSNDFLIAVRLSIPPWPYRIRETCTSGPLLLGLNKANMKHLYLCDVYQNNDVDGDEDVKEGSQWHAGMLSGIVLKATARGRSVREAQRRVYRTLDGIEIADKQYRLDIGDGVEAELRFMAEQGLV